MRKPGMRKLRDDAGLSQEALATEAGVSRSMVSQVECGSKRPSITTMERLAKALGVTLDRVVRAVHGPGARLRTIGRAA